MYLCTCVSVYLCIYVSVYLCTCVSVYLWEIRSSEKDDVGMVAMRGVLFSGWSLRSPAKLFFYDCLFEKVVLCVAVAKARGALWQASGDGFGALEVSQSLDMNTWDCGWNWKCSF